MTKTKGFGPRPKTQLRRYSYKDNSVSIVKDNGDASSSLYEVGVFFKNGKNYAERQLSKKEALSLYSYYKRMIKNLN